MGNIYTDESLWRARIHPKRLGVNLKDDELRRLHRAMRDVLNEAIRMRGSSVSDYVDSEGQRGTFQQRHRVYQRKGKKCFRGDGIIRRAIVAGRSSYFCPALPTRATHSPPIRQLRARGPSDALALACTGPHQRAGPRVRTGLSCA